MHKSTCKFAKYFKRVIEESIVDATFQQTLKSSEKNKSKWENSLQEMTAGDAGVGSSGDGFSPENINSGDFYASGDARVPKVLGKVQRRNVVVKKNKKQKKKVYLPGENAEEAMCPDACCGKPVKDCKCGPDCPHCDCHEINNA
ncbi:hypothetical protein N9273_00060 [bacterium]|nr:hypothetical protein [bacterium]